MLWFAEKFVSLLIEQHHGKRDYLFVNGCDLLKNSYLCLLNNTSVAPCSPLSPVVICWKIRIFAYWTTPELAKLDADELLWFAEKFVSLLIEQHQLMKVEDKSKGCDLLKNSYLCLLNNTLPALEQHHEVLWFAEKFVSLLIEQHLAKHVSRSVHELWFAEKFVSLLIEQHPFATALMNHGGCDLLKNSYLCLLNNTKPMRNISG